jgi:hypothetical protein
VGRVVGSAEVLGEEAGQGLHLVAAGEEGELFGVRLAQVAQTLLHDVEGLVPGDGLELAGAALGAGLAAQGLGEPRRRVLLHDAGRTLGADHTLIEGVIGIALDIAYLAVAQGHADAAATGAHVAGGVLDLDAFFQLGRSGVIGHR